MSCGQIALQKSNIPVKKYYASEIDKYGQIVSKANFPNTNYLGDVRFVNVGSLDKINLLLGGSPCQSFSFAGKRKGMSTKSEIEILTLEQYLELKEQKFEFEGQSYLFWEYMRVLTEIRKINPEVKFLLENVMMGSKWQKVLTRAIGINPICINSALVSAQNRERLYWTNIASEPGGLFGDLICGIPQPKDKFIFLKDILQKEFDPKYILSEKMMKYFENRAANFNNGKVNIRELFDKASAITSSSSSIDISDNFIKVDTKFRLGNQKKSSTLMVGGNGSGNHSDMDLIVHNMMPRSGDPSKGGPCHLSRNDGKTYCLDTGQTNAVEMVNCIRRLTPMEYERLQTVPDNYTNHVSDTQRYKMLGNGWTIDVIAHIFSHLKF